MDIKECTSVLRRMISHQEHIYQNLYAVDPGGTKTKAKHVNDIFLDALRLAVQALEEKQ